MAVVAERIPICRLYLRVSKATFGIATDWRRGKATGGCVHDLNLNVIKLIELADRVRIPRTIFLSTGSEMLKSSTAFFKLGSAV